MQRAAPQAEVCPQVTRSLEGPAGHTRTHAERGAPTCSLKGPRARTGREVNTVSDRTAPRRPDARDGGRRDTHVALLVPSPGASCSTTQRQYPSQLCPQPLPSGVCVSASREINSLGARARRCLRASQEEDSSDITSNFLNGGPNSCSPSSVLHTEGKCAPPRGGTKTNRVSKLSHPHFTFL